MALSSLIAAQTFEYKYGVVYIGSNAMANCSALRTVFLPSSVLQMSVNTLQNAGAAGTTLNVYWASLRPDLVDIRESTFSNANFSAINTYFPTKDALVKAQATSYITNHTNVYGGQKFQIWPLIS